MDDLQGKVALITGAGSGIGKATALMMSRHGIEIAAVDRKEEELADLVHEFSSHASDLLPLVADVSCPADIESAIDRAETHFGRLDIVFANAGVNGVWAPIEDLAPDEFLDTIRINLAGTFYTIKYSVPYLKRQGGSIIITSSVNGTRMFSNTGATAYAASKGGQVVIGRMLALELAKYHIRVNTVCPGTIATDIRESTEKRNLQEIRIPVEFPHGHIPLTGKAASPDRVAEVVLFLASDDCSFVTGTEIWVDGAQSLLEG
jgi:NAD(P)-dependent dehydrogenase (short-subunit alcohol dehydrogenase family)